MAVTTIDWIAMTVKQEAEGEDEIGKLAVAYNIVNRIHSPKYPSTAAQVVLQPYQYSCWNTTSPTRKRAQPNLQEKVWQDSYDAATHAWNKTKPDPTHGATSYLNPDHCTADQKKRAGYTREKVTLIHGRHHFFFEI